MGGVIPTPLSRERAGASSSASGSALRSKSTIAHAGIGRGLRQAGYCCGLHVGGWLLRRGLLIRIGVVCLRTAALFT
jgi:hypothetical protein